MALPAFRIRAAHLERGAKRHPPDDTHFHAALYEISALNPAANQLLRCACGTYLIRHELLKAWLVSRDTAELVAEWCDTRRALY